MPSLRWNRRWGLELRRHQNRGAAFHYGEQWGSPEHRGLHYLWAKLRRGRRLPGDLSRVVDRYIEPYLVRGGVTLEIGSGGGRWTRYLLASREVIAVELNPEFFPYLERRFRRHRHKLRFYQTEGYELSGVAAGSVDFAFTFGTLGHLEVEGVRRYLDEVARVLRPGAAATLHYTDVGKPFFRHLPAEELAAFAPLRAADMEAMVAEAGFAVIEHDRTLLNHSNLLVVEGPGGGEDGSGNGGEEAP